jgi:hypothetical protein
VCEGEGDAGIGGREKRRRVRGEIEEMLVRGLEAGREEKRGRVRFMFLLFLLAFLKPRC